ncbi:hypothetical protein [Klebsiella aerogenes]|uniref:hypothetical protein n=1 Tax=Klebsiella aerogenes TaxID=548 RepID=UPI0013CF745F|nr:hypothetical protein [Klebsiella aerogenes]
MNDITELARKVITEVSAIDDTQWYLAKPSEIRLLVEALEKAQQVDEELCKLLPPGVEYMDPPDGGDVTPLEGVRRMVADYRQRIAELREWNAGLAQESFERQQCISEIEPIRAAAEKLVRCKGRYHSEQNYRALAALFGVTTPDLPPLDGESRTVTVKLPPLNDDLISILGRPNFMCAHLAELLRKSGEDIKRKSEHEQAAVIHWFLGIYLEHADKWEGVAKSDMQARAAGIKWEAE